MTSIRAPREGLTWLTTSISVANIDKAIALYTEVFGFTVHELIRDKQEKALFARITYRECNITMFTPGAIGSETRMMPPATTGNYSPINFYLYCDDLDQVYKKAKEQQVIIIQEPILKFWGDRAFRIVDFDGYIWDIAFAETTFNPKLLPQELR